jgi:AcrR family transcriptional regulator
VASVLDDKGPDPDASADELTRTLLDRAGEMLLEHGPGGLSLRKLAAAVGTSTMSVYTRFGGKPQLLAALHREGFERLGRALAEVPDTGDPLEVLARVGQAYRRAALASPSLYGLMFGPPPPDLVLSPEDAAAAGATYRPLVDAVRRCVDAGVLHGDPDDVALHLWAVAHGMVGLELAGRLPDGAPAPGTAYDRALTFAAMPFLVTPR